MVDAAAVGVLTTDRELRVRSWNHWLAAATGLSPEQVTGRPLEEVTGGPSSAWYRELFDEVLDTGTPRVLAPAFHRYLIPCAPLEPSALFERMQQRVAVAPLRRGEAIIGLLLTVEDVTGRIESERQLAAELARNPAATPADPKAWSDWRVRRASVEALRRTATRNDIEQLVRTLERDHHDINVLSSALDVLVAADVDVTPALVSLLEDDDPNLRMHAALALGRMRSEAAVPALLARLADGDQNVRFHAIEALGSIGARDAVDALTAIAESGDFFVGFAAIDALSKIDDASVVGRLAGLLEHDELRPAVIDTLAALGDEDSVAPLVAVVNRGGIHVPQAAAAIERIHARYHDAFEAGDHIADLVRRTIRPEGVAALTDALARRPSALRPLVAVLGWVGADALPALLDVLGEPSVQASVEQAIAAIGPAAVAPLVARLESGTRDERLAATALLGRIAHADAVPALTARLTSPDAELVAAAAGALAAIGDGHPLESLLVLFAHPRASVRRAAIAAVNAIGAAATRPLIHRRLADPDPLVRECAVRVAGYFGFEECAPALLAATDDADEGVRRAAIEQLPVIQEPPAVSALLRALTRETPRNRAAAAHALALVDDDGSVRALIAALDDDDSWVRYFAAGSLARRTVIEAVPALVERARRDPATHVRIAALHALGLLDAPHLVDLATEMLREADADLVAAALAALAGVSDPRIDRLLEDAAQSSNAACRIPAVQAMATRGTAGATEILAWAARSDEPPELAAVAVEALRRMATTAGAELRRAAVQALLGLAAETAHRDAALAAIAALPASAIDDVAGVLDGTRVSLRLAAVEALARMRNRHASEALRRALQDSDPVVRGAAVAAFGRVGTPSAGPSIAAMRWSDPDPAVRRRAEAVVRRHAWTPEDPRP